MTTHRGRPGPPLLDIRAQAPPGPRTAVVDAPCQLAPIRLRRSGHLRSTIMLHLSDSCAGNDPDGQLPLASRIMLLLEEHTPAGRRLSVLGAAFGDEGKCQVASMSCVEEVGEVAYVLQARHGSGWSCGRQVCIACTYLRPQT